MKELLKNTFPAIFMMWFIFFIELLNMDFVEILNSNSDNLSSYTYIYYYQNIKLFLLYTIAGFIFGIISYIILYKKRKRKFSLLNRSDELYVIYFLKTGSISFVILFSLLLREVINQPSLFQTTLLNESNLFFSIFNFFYSFFSPLYFTSILVFIISLFIYKLVKMMSVEETISKVISYIVSILILILLIFNYGFLNAKIDENDEISSIDLNGKYKYGKFNLLMIGVEGLERKYFAKGFNEKYLFENFRGFYELKLRSYNFQNCYSTSSEFIPSLISSVNGLHPDYSEYRYNYPFNKNKILYKEKYDNYFEKLRGDFNYNTFITGDNEFQYFRNYSEQFISTNSISEANSVTDESHLETNFPVQSIGNNLRANVIIKHPFFISFTSNTFMLNRFEELTSSRYYMDKRFLRKDIISFMKKNTLARSFEEKFAILYLISKKSDIKLPYPYDSMVDTKGNIDRDRNFTKYIDEELQILIEKLKENKLYNKTVIVLFGLPESDKSGFTKTAEGNLLTRNLKIPLLISSPEFKNEKIVKRNYTNLDIYPTSFELVTGQSLRDKIDGISLLDTVFTRRDIFISEGFDDLINRVNLEASNSDTLNQLFLLENSNSFISKSHINKYESNNFCNLNYKYKSFFSLFTKRSYIRGDYKLNVYPKSEYIEYKLFDIKIDPYERNNLSIEKKRVLDRMINRMHKKYEKRYGYTFINGYFVK